MQLYALNSDGSALSARSASKKVNYSCIECGEVVRLREGEFRQPHFYHLNPPPSCRQNGKSLTHIQLQFYIQSKIGADAVQLEKPFPAIHRVADSVWEKEKIVFEVQCSPMTKEEMQKRTADYESIGYQVVWILHERNYNQWRMTALEEAVQTIPHYYSNFSPGGEGYIYDQWQYAANGKRMKVLPRLPIEISKPIRLKKQQSFGSAYVEKRAQNWPLYFEGDLLTLKEQSFGEDYLRRAQFHEKELKPKKISWWKWAIDAYRRLVLEAVKPYCK